MSPEALTEFFNLSPEAQKRFVYPVSIDRSIRITPFINRAMLSFASVIPDEVVIEGLEGNSFDEFEHPQKADPRLQQFAEDYWNAVWHYAQRAPTKARLKFGISAVVVDNIRRADSISLKRFIAHTPQCFSLRPTVPFLQRLTSPKGWTNTSLHEFERIALTAQSLLRDVVCSSKAFSAVCSYAIRIASEDDGEDLSPEPTPAITERIRERELRDRGTARAQLEHAKLPMMSIRDVFLSERQWMRRQAYALMICGCSRRQVMGLTGITYDTIKNETAYLKSLGCNVTDGRKVRESRSPAHDLTFRRQVYLGSILYLATRAQRDAIDLDIPAFAQTLHFLHDKEHGMQKFAPVAEPLTGAELMEICLGWRMSRYRLDRWSACTYCGAELFAVEGTPTPAREGVQEPVLRCPVCHKRCKDTRGNPDFGKKRSLTDLMEKIVDDARTRGASEDEVRGALRDYVDLLDRQDSEVREANRRREIEEEEQRAAEALRRAARLEPELEDEPEDDPSEEDVFDDESEEASAGFLNVEIDESFESAPRQQPAPDGDGGPTADSSPASGENGSDR